MRMNRGAKAMDVADTASISIIIVMLLQADGRSRIERVKYNGHFLIQRSGAQNTECGCRMTVTKNVWTRTCYRLKVASVVLKTRIIRDVFHVAAPLLAWTSCGVISRGGAVLRGVNGHRNREQEFRIRSLRGSKVPTMACSRQESVLLFASAAWRITCKDRLRHSSHRRPQSNLLQLIPHRLALAI